MQEATLCFLAEVERYGEETARTHGRTIWHSLWDAVRRAYPLHIAYNAFHAGKRQPLRVDQLEAMSNRIAKADPTERTAERIDLRRVLEEMNEADRKIIRRRLEGDTQREIGRSIGLNDMQMCRMMKRIRRQLVSFTAD